MVGWEKRAAKKEAAFGKGHSVPPPKPVVRRHRDRRRRVVPAHGRAHHVRVLGGGRGGQRGKRRRSGGGGGRRGGGGAGGAAGRRRRRGTAAGGGGGMSFGFDVVCFRKDVLRKGEGIFSLLHACSPRRTPTRGALRPRLSRASPAARWRSARPAGSRPSLATWFPPHPTLRPRNSGSRCRATAAPRSRRARWCSTRPWPRRSPRAARWWLSRAPSCRTACHTPRTCRWRARWRRSCAREARRPPPWPSSTACPASGWTTLTCAGWRSSARARARFPDGMSRRSSRDARRARRLSPRPRCSPRARACPCSSPAASAACIAAARHPWTSPRTSPSSPRPPSPSSAPAPRACWTSRARWSSWRRRACPSSATASKSSPRSSPEAAAATRPPSPIRRSKPRA
mmetsp:Transcript_12038/g.50402  ORF Transcript_12038/g.50402 Transcript_12038/m.50402 type:complete len:399 (-) Transcript_12038:356-1552(-)